MSSRTVQIVSNNARVGADSINNALVIQDEIHANIHRGIVFVASKQESIASAGVNEYLIRVPAGIFSHMRLAVAVSQEMTAELFSGPTTTADGTSLASHNRLISSTNTASTLFFVGPTVTVDGTLKVEAYLPGGSGNFSTGGTNAGSFEWVLEPGDYLLRVSNDIAAPAAAGRMGVVFDFYEPE